jgi:UDP-N-acetylglucosamine--N-acetylmuramyl-(pentapeptide) pyrophosphoryl-undecaprenol N-acetylglucosamine transferase
MKILFTGGGTGGHIFPIIAIIREIKKNYRGKDLRFVFIGPKDEIGSSLFSKEGIEVKTILAGKVRRYITIKSIFQNLFDICIKTPIGFIQAFFYIFIVSPDTIFSKGGFGSISVVLAGKLLFVPIFLHESDIIPGFANKISRGLALEIFTSFPNTECFSSKKLLLVGNPIRKELLGGSKEEGKKNLNIKSDKPIIFILGGSQGAQRINEEILEILPLLLKEFEIIHQCGKKNYEIMKIESEIMIDRELTSFYHLFPFLEEKELKSAYAAANLIVSRAGSGSIFEIAAAGKPSILIPLPQAAQNHQVKNAYAYQTKEAAIVIEQNNFTGNFFLGKLRYLFNNPDKIIRMSARAREFSRPQASRIIANYLIEYLTK